MPDVVPAVGVHQKMVAGPELVQERGPEGAAAAAQLAQGQPSEEEQGGPAQGIEPEHGQDEGGAAAAMTPVPVQ